MLRRQQIMLNDRLWQVDRWFSFADSHKVAVSHCLVCPACGRTWATLSFPDDRLIWPVAAFCGCTQDADDWRPVPGSILVEEGYGEVDDSLLNALPGDLLRREFELHLKAFSHDNFSISITRC